MLRRWLLLGLLLRLLRRLWLRGLVLVIWRVSVVSRRRPRGACGLSGTVLVMGHHVWMRMVRLVHVARIDRLAGQRSARSPSRCSRRGLVVAGACSRVAGRTLWRRVVTVVVHGRILGRSVGARLSWRG